jgi:hypothetical protein
MTFLANHPIFTQNTESRLLLISLNDTALNYMGMQTKELKEDLMITFFD